MEKTLTLSADEAQFIKDMFLKLSVNPAESNAMNVCKIVQSINSKLGKE